MRLFARILSALKGLFTRNKTVVTCCGCIYHVSLAKPL
jgi:hypothetical protein